MPCNARTNMQTNLPCKQVEKVGNVATLPPKNLADQRAAATRGQEGKKKRRFCLLSCYRRGAKQPKTSWRHRIILEKKVLVLDLNQMTIGRPELHKMCLNVALDVVGRLGCSWCSFFLPTRQPASTRGRSKFCGCFTRMRLPGELQLRDMKRHWPYPIQEVHGDSVQKCQYCSIEGSRMFPQTVTDEKGQEKWNTFHQISPAKPFVRKLMEEGWRNFLHTTKPIIHR